MTIVGKGVQGLREALGEMAAAVQDNLDRVAGRLAGTGTATTAEVLAADAKINEFEIRLDHMCEVLLALREPYAADFRTVFGAIKTTRDLERIGDECKRVARFTDRLEGPPPDPLVELALATREEVAEAIRALRLGDPGLARGVLASDRSIDRLETSILDTTRSVPVAFIAHAFERIGDRATNIAETVIYVVRAEDVRHRSKDG